MPESHFSYGVGWNATRPLTNIETLFATGPDYPGAPGVLPTDVVPVILGSVRTETRDGTVRYDGFSTIHWNWAAMTGEDLANMVNTIWGLYGNAVGSTELTILTPTSLSTVSRLVWASYNVWAELPQPGLHYEDTLSGRVQGLRVPMKIHSTAGAFTSGFSLGFKV